MKPSTKGTSISVVVEATPAPKRAVAGFDRWVASSLPPQASTLNIGAGADRSGNLLRVRSRSQRLVGVDPSPGIHDHPWLDERYQMSLEEFASGHAEEFDLAFSVFVLEHVSRPVDFAQACAQVLKPGGTLMGMTVNKWHYFGITAWASTRMGVSDWLLHKLMDDSAIDHYHFPTEYRFNTVGSVSRLLAGAGFPRVEFRMWDLPAMYAAYLPAPLTHVAATWNRTAYRLGRPQMMGHLTFKAVL